MTSPRPRDAFHLDLAGTTIVGRYIEVDSPHRMLVGWDLQGPGSTTPTSALIEFKFTPTGGGNTALEVQLSRLSAEDAELYRPLFARYLDRIRASFPGDTGARRDE